MWAIALAGLRCFGQVWAQFMMGACPTRIFLVKRPPAHSWAVYDMARAKRIRGMGAHYLDITAEIDVFEGLLARDAEAMRAGVTLMPGVGFDVVPSDCLAAHLKRKLPDATHLTIYLTAGFNASRGSLKTMIEGIADGVRARRNGRLVTLARPDTGSCNFGKGLRPTIQIPWGDLSTAFHSTGIPNIEVHVERRRRSRPSP